MTTPFYTGQPGPLAVNMLNELWALIAAAAGEGLANPMTAAGDLVVGGAVLEGIAVPARLPKGAEGQVLKIVGGALVWATPAVLPVCTPIACGDEVTPITPKTNVISFHWPQSGTLTGVWIGLNAVQASGNKFTVDLKNVGASMLSTTLTIDNGQENSLNAAVQPVISGGAVVKGTRATVDVTQIGNGTAAGLKMYFTVQPS